MGWVGLTGFSGVECEGRTLSSFIDEKRDAAAEFGFNHFKRVFRNLSMFVPDGGGREIKSNPKRDAHAPSSYETSNVYLIKKSKSFSATTSQCVQGSQCTLSPSPVGVASLISSPFGSPTITRKGSINRSADSCEVRWDTIRISSGLGQPAGVRVQLSTVPIGSKHFAVLCIPVIPSKGVSF